MREVWARLHALETQVALLTHGLTLAKEQIGENDAEGRRNADQLLVMKTRQALVSSLIGAGAALGMKLLLH